MIIGLKQHILTKSCLAFGCIQLSSIWYMKSVTFYVLGLFVSKQIIREQNLNVADFMYQIELI